MSKAKKTENEVVKELLHACAFIQEQFPHIYNTLGKVLHRVSDKPPNRSIFEWL